MAARNRVVVTGMGTVNPLGKTVASFWRNCMDGASGVKKIEAFAIPEHMSQIAGVVDGFRYAPLGLDVDRESQQLDRSLHFALQATGEAMIDAGLSGTELARAGTRSAVLISTAIAQISRMEAAFRRLSANGTRRIAPVGPNGNQPNCFFFNSTSGEVARRFNVRQGYATIATGCTGGVDALGHALQMIRRGHADLVIAGATEAPITPLVVAAFSKIGATSCRNQEPRRASRPYDVERDGFVLAEGCGILVLESLEHARARNARIYAEVSGFGSVNNYFHMTSIPQDGNSIARACWQALEDAGIAAAEVDFINAHGSSTPQNDIAEANAFSTVFDNRVRHIPVTSIKSQTGHSLSAANAIEVISAILSIRDGVIPPTINLEQLDDRCPLDVVGPIARPADVNCVLKTSSGFSGIHSSLIIEKFH